LLSSETGYSAINFFSKFPHVISQILLRYFLKKYISQKKNVAYCIQIFFNIQILPPPYSLIKIFSAARGGGSKPIKLTDAPPSIPTTHNLFTEAK
jgi:hypothetical protein